MAVALPGLRQAAIAALIALSAIAAGPASAEPQRFKIDPAHSFPHFAVSHLGFSTHRGRFDRTTGTVELDAAAGRGRIVVEIDAGSVDTGDPELEKQLRSDSFFDAATFPTLRFESSDVRFDGDRPVSASGTLTLRGVSKPVEITIERYNCGLHPLLRQRICGAEASATIRRSDFGMSKFPSMIGDEVAISLQVEGVLETAADTAERVERVGR